MLSTRTIHHLKPLALALALAALAVPTAHGNATPAGKYGPLDPAIAAAIRSHQRAQSVPLITEHSAGQNRATAFSHTGDVPYVHPSRSPLYTQAVRDYLASKSQLRPDDRAGIRGIGSEPVSTPVSFSAPSNGFHWGDAGIGGGVAFAAMLLAVGLATLIMRRGRRRLAGF